MIILFKYILSSVYFEDICKCDHQKFLTDLLFSNITLISVDFNYYYCEVHENQTTPACVPQIKKFKTKFGKKNSP